MAGILGGLAGLAAEVAASVVFFDANFLYQETKLSAGGGLSENLIMYVFVAPLIEEFLKYLAIKKIGFPSKYFNQIVDGVIYAVAVALGFALFENFLYFFEYSPENIYALISIFTLRMFMSTLLHTLSTGWMGYWMGKAKFSAAPRRKFILIGFVFAVVIHAVFNYLMIIGAVFYAILLLVAVSALFFEKIRSVGAQMFWYPAKNIKIPNS